ncbi:MAG: hypothetical protein U0232_27480 [Thermomicrobiales bacterium]
MLRQIVPPSTEQVQPTSIRPSSAAGSNSLTRAAANSSASGNPSSRAQIAATLPAFLVQREIDPDRPRRSTTAAPPSRDGGQVPTRTTGAVAPAARATPRVPRQDAAATGLSPVRAARTLRKQLPDMWRGIEQMLAIVEHKDDHPFP